MAEGVILGANSLLGTERSSAGFCGIGAWQSFAQDFAEIRQAQTAPAAQAIENNPGLFLGRDMWSGCARNIPDYIFRRLA